MLYFCCLKDVGAELPPGGAVTLYQDLRDARKRCDGRIAVVDGRTLHPPVTDTAGRPLERVPAVPPSTTLNVDPYLKPKRVTAGGGLIVRSGPTGPELLLIFRRGVWDLPKGKIDKGESIEDGAVREVCEEVGIDDVNVIDYVATTRHGYERGGRYEVKDTHWYLMRTKATVFTPQEVEQIEKVEWRPLADVIELLEFETLRELVRDFRTNLSSDPSAKLGSGTRYQISI